MQSVTTLQGLRPQRKASGLWTMARFLCLLFGSTLCFGCHPAVQREAERPQEALIRVQFPYPSFEDDMDFASLATAIRENLEYLRRLEPDQIFEYGPDRYTCRQITEGQEDFLRLISTSPSVEAINRKLKKDYLLYRAAGRPAKPSVLFSGYYEPTYEASLKPDSTFRHPIYGKPEDLIKIDLSPFREEFKGKSIVARISGKRVLPYYTRKEIAQDKVLAGRKLELAWLKDSLDVAFLQIQGSGRLRLPDGSILRVGYETGNGRPYQSVGRYMIEKGYLTREETSMQSIRRYLTRHPEVKEDVLNQNPSYVFFRVVSGGPYGNINVPLTPGRSLALDNRLFPRGALCFVRTQKPVLNSREEITGWTDFSRFVLHQDTGGAIRGAGRADLFWGADRYAETAAGHMKHEGDLYLLVKKP
ncbi:MAG: MltA domain-containing protein [Deltaproteobacteria bacterium]|nr:MltA domain-containing protein [Deltaproteobacteria bacterium]